MMRKYWSVLRIKIINKIQICFSGKPSESYLFIINFMKIVKNEQNKQVSVLEEFLANQ